MNPHQAYKNSGQISRQLPRIEMLLRLYDGAIELIEKSLDLLKKNDPIAAQPHLAHAQAVITGMAGSVDMSFGELPKNFTQLYEFVQYSLSAGNAENVEAALSVLTTVREGLQEIRPKAIEMERAGEISPLVNLASLTTIA